MTYFVLLWHGGMHCRGEPWLARMCQTGMREYGTGIFTTEAQRHRDFFFTTEYTEGTEKSIFRVAYCLPNGHKGSRQNTIGGLMVEKQRIESFIREDIKGPIKHLIEQGDIESAEILIYTRIDTLRHLTPSLFKRGDRAGEKYKKWVSQFMPLDYGNGIELTPEELWVTRCDYVHNGGASERQLDERRIVLREDTEPENSREQKDVRISLRDFVVNFGISTRECYQWICADKARLSDALTHLSKMKYVRVDLSGIGLGRSHSWDYFRDEHWRLFYDLGDQHVVECAFYLYNFATGTIEPEDTEYLGKSIKGYDNLYSSNDVLAYEVKTTGLLWTKNVTDEQYTSEELFRMAQDDFDSWYRKSGAHKRFNIAAISNIRTQFCKHGRQRQTENKLHICPYQQTPMIL